MAGTKEYAGSILMLVENFFPGDPRVRHEAFTLVEAGYRVSVIALRRSGERWRENVNGVHVYRVPHVHIFKKSTARKSRALVALYRIKSALGYILEYMYITSICLLLAPVIGIINRADAVHAHNPPNSLFLVGLVFKLLGKKYVFDHHDLSPELYLSKYGIKGGLIHKILVLEERLCIRLADMVIATNESYKDIEIRRGGVTPEKIFIVRNGPVHEEIHFTEVDQQLRTENKHVLVYVGAMGPQDGVDYLLRAVHHLVYKLNRQDFICIVIGPGDALQDLRHMSKELNVSDFVRLTGYIPKADLLRYLSSADICLDPNPSSPLNDSSTWIKVMEYMVMGKPVVSFDLKETRYTAGDAALYVPPNSEEAFAEAILKLMDDPELRIEMGRRGKKRIQEELAWEHTSKNLLAAYEWLLNRKVPESHKSKIKDSIEAR